MASAKNKKARHVLINNSVYNTEKLDRSAHWIDFDELCSAGDKRRITDLEFKLTAIQNTLNFPNESRL